MDPLISIFKTSTLIGIEVFDKKEVNYLKWQPFKKGWFFKQEEGFRDTFPFGIEHIFSSEELEAGSYNGIPLIVEDKKAYYRPYITFTFTEGRKYHTYTKTFEDAEKIAQSRRRAYLGVYESISFETKK